MYTLEEQHLYYNTLLSTIDSGILVLNRNGTIEWYNKTVLREFGLTSLRQLSELAAITPDLPDLLLRLIPGETHILRLEQSGRVRDFQNTGQRIIIDQPEKHSFGTGKQ